MNCPFSVAVSLIRVNFHFILHIHFIRVKLNCPWLHFHFIRVNCPFLVWICIRVNCPSWAGYALKRVNCLGLDMHFTCIRVHIIMKCPRLFVYLISMKCPILVAYDLIRVNFHLKQAYSLYIE